MLLLADAEPLSLSLRIPLSMMMLLEYSIWGAWFVVLGNYLDSLKFSRKDIGRIYATMALGTIISPLVVGTIADRFFPSQIVLALLHFVGAALLYWMAQIRTASLFYWVALLYAVVYGPTTALTNSITFNAVPDAGRDFPTVRVLGTIGWIIAASSAWLFVRPGESVNNRPLLLAAVLSVALGMYSFLLPHTPPGAAGSGAEAKARVEDGKVVAVEIVSGGSGYQKPPGITIEGGGGQGLELKTSIDDGAVTKVEVVNGGSGYTEPPQLEFRQSLFPFIKAFNLLSDRSFAVFFVVSFLITIALAFYYSFTAIYLETAIKVKPENIGPLMSIGQWMEILFLLALPYVLINKQSPDSGFLSMKAVLIIGMTAWALRYGIFAARPPLALVVVGVALHGICFDFFFAAAFIHVEQTASPEFRASAQSLFIFLTYGLGMFLGTEASGRLNQLLTKETIDPTTGLTTRVTDWRTFWLIPCVAVVVCLIPFVLFF